MNTPTLSAEQATPTPAYTAAVQKLRGLIETGLSQPVQGAMDSAYFSMLRQRVAQLSKKPEKQHAFA